MPSRSATPTKSGYHPQVADRAAGPLPGGDATMIVGDLVRIIVASYHSPQIGEITFCTRVSAVGGAGATVQEVAAFYLAALTADWQATNFTGVSLSGVRAEVLSTGSGRVYQAGQAADNVTAGTVANGLCPGTVAAVCKKTTAQAGRAYRGRCYMPFVPSDFTTVQGVLTAPGKALYQTYANNLMTTTVVVGAGGTVTLVPVLLHRTVPLTSTDLVSTPMSGLLGNQRRRGDYGQPNPPLS